MAGTMPNQDNETSIIIGISSEINCNEDAACNGTEDYSSSYYYQFTDWTVVGPATAAYSLIFVLGLAGNSMVLFAVSQSRRLHTATSFLLANLAVADLIIILLLLPIKMVVELLDHWPFGEAVCRIAAFVAFVSPTCSVYTMVVIALERCYAVLYPLRTRSMITMGRTRLAIVLIWLFSLLVCIPAIFAKTTTDHSYGDEQWTSCNNAWPSQVASLGYTIYQTTLLLVFPALTTTACYVLIIVRLCSSKRLTKHMRPLSASNIPLPKLPKEDRATVLTATATLADEAESCVDGRRSSCRGYSVVAQRPQRQKKKDPDQLRRIVVMLILLLVIFVLCWTPLFTYGLLLRLRLTSPDYSDQVWKISLALHLIAYGNSCVNPFVYAFMSESFREGFAVACLCCIHRRRSKYYRKRSSTTSSSQRPSTYWSVANTRHMSVSSNSANPYRVRTSVVT